jgi:hypothetical protein
MLENEWLYWSINLKMRSKIHLQYLNRPHRSFPLPQQISLSVLPSMSSLVSFPVEQQRQAVIHKLLSEPTARWNILLPVDNTPILLRRVAESPAIVPVSLTLAKEWFQHDPTEALPCHCPWVQWRVVPGQDQQHIWLCLASAQAPFPTLQALQDLVPQYMITALYREFVLANLMPVFAECQVDGVIDCRKLYQLYRSKDWNHEVYSFLTRAFDYYWYQQSKLDMHQFGRLCQQMPKLGLCLRKHLDKPDVLRAEFNKLCSIVLPFHVADELYDDKNHQEPLQVGDYFCHYLNGQVSAPSVEIPNEDVSLWPSCKQIFEGLLNNYARGGQVAVPLQTLTALTPQVRTLIRHGVLIAPAAGHDGLGRYYLYSYLDDMQKLESFLGSLISKSHEDSLQQRPADMPAVQNWEDLVRRFCSKYELVILNTPCGEHSLIEELAQVCSTVYYPNKSRDTTAKSSTVPVWLVRDAHLWGLREFLLRVVLPFRTLTHEPRLVISLDMDAATTLPTLFRKSGLYGRVICPTMEPSKSPSTYSASMQRMIHSVRQHLQLNPLATPTLDLWQASSEGAIASVNNSAGCHALQSTDYEPAVWMPQMLTARKDDAIMSDKRVLFPCSLQSLRYSIEPSPTNEATLRVFYTALLCARNGLAVMV